MYPEQFVEFLQSEKSIAIIRTLRSEIASQAMEAAINGGFRIAEFTLTIPGAFDLIRQFSRRKELAVGAGTVLTVEDARIAAEAGAAFLVSPVLDQAVIAEARKLGVAVIPGTQTPTEMYQAYQWGAPLQKVFPTPVGAPAYIRQCMGPMPFLRLIPTNTIDETNASEFLKAGAYALGFGVLLFQPEWMSSERYDLIEQKARLLTAAARGNV